MPLPHKTWYHVTLGTYGSWLPGDPRGFRARHHNIHSSGDHKSPPPKDEHAGLHQFSQSVSSQAFVLPKALRKVVCNRIVTTLLNRDHRLLIAAVVGMHVHLLVELPRDHKQGRYEIGIAKKSASHTISPLVTGRVWAKGCGLKPIRDEDHHRNTFAYIGRHAQEGAFVWTFRDQDRQLTRAALACANAAGLES